MERKLSDVNIRIVSGGQNEMKGEIKMEASDIWGGGLRSTRKFQQN